MTFQTRQNLGEVAEDILRKCLGAASYAVSAFGSAANESIHRCEEPLPAIWKSDQVKKSNTALLVRYAPDYLAVSISKSAFKDAMFVDAKAMITPVYLDTFLMQLEKQHGKKFSTENVGNVEREAWLTYNAYHNAGAKVAILAVCSFHPRPLLCEYIERIQPLFKDARERNPDAAGSTTPRVNVDLSSMRSLSQFLKDENQVDIEGHENYKNSMQIVNGRFALIGAPGNWRANKDRAERVEAVRGELSKLTGRQLEIFWMGMGR
jgi:hypothetical protein